MFETSGVGYPVTHLHVAGDLNALGNVIRTNKMNTFYINVLNFIILSSICFEHPSVHPQEDLYMQFNVFLSCIRISSLVDGRICLTSNVPSVLVNDQLDALFLSVFISTPLYVLSSKCSSSGGPTH